MKKNAVILVSGGLDSAVTLAIAKALGFSPFALSFSYGQRHRVELEAASRVAKSLGAMQHLVISIDLSSIGGSALTDTIPVPKDRMEENVSGEIPITYVPARNTIFLAIALGWAEVLEAENLFIGVNAVDFSGYPDCRPEFIRAFEKTANLATKAAVEGRVKIRIQTPLIHMNKAEIIRKGLTLGVDFSITHSCYDPFPEGRACGRCDSCKLRQKGFREAGFTDPIPYADA